DVARARMRQRTQQQPCVQHAVRLVVLRIFRFSRDLGHEIRRHIVLSNEFAGHSSCPPRHRVVTASSTVKDHSILADSTFAKNTCGSCCTYAVPVPGPVRSTATCNSRPLIELWNASRNVPLPGTVSFDVFHSTRNDPDPLSNDSVCTLPTPCHEPRRCQATSGFAPSGFGGCRQPISPRSTANTTSGAYRPNGFALRAPGLRSVISPQS